jgi:hypothetical protein
MEQQPSEQRNELPLQPQQQQQHHHNQNQQHQQPQNRLRSPLPHPSLVTQLPTLTPMTSRTAESTPLSSPGLFSPTALRHSILAQQTSLSESNTPAPLHNGLPYLHPLQTHKVREYVHDSLLHARRSPPILRLLHSFVLPPTLCF